MSLLYDRKILDAPLGGGLGDGLGISFDGVVVGSGDRYVASNSYEVPAMWLPNQPHTPIIPYLPDLPGNGRLLDIDRFGNAIGSLNDRSSPDTYLIVSGTSLVFDTRSLFGSACPDTASRNSPRTTAASDLKT